MYLFAFLITWLLVFSKSGEDHVDNIIEAWNVWLSSESPFHKQIFGKWSTKYAHSPVKEKSCRKSWKNWNRSERGEPKLKGSHKINQTWAKWRNHELKNTWLQICETLMMKEYRIKNASYDSKNLGGTVWKNYKLLLNFLLIQSSSSKDHIGNWNIWDRV